MAHSLKHDSALVILSGGQDSTTCLFWAKQHFKDVYALTMHYGQRHAIEVSSAMIVAKMAGVVLHEVLDLAARTAIYKNGVLTSGVRYDVLVSSSPLVKQSEQLEQYKDWQSLPGGLEKTFVPGRNTLFAVLAANRAYALGVPNLVMGICQEDFGGYPDCREDFRISIANALRQGLDFPLELHAPLMFLTKAETVRMAKALPECWDALAFTHTAYNGLYPPKGQDHATLLRAKGFEQACLPDPLVVRAWHEGLMNWPKTNNYLLISGIDHRSRFSKCIGDGMVRCECGFIYLHQGGNEAA